MDGELFSIVPGPVIPFDRRIRNSDLNGFNKDIFEMLTFCSLQMFQFIFTM